MYGPKISAPECEETSRGSVVDGERGEPDGDLSHIYVTKCHHTFYKVLQHRRLELHHDPIASVGHVSTLHALGADVSSVTPTFVTYTPD